MKIIYHNNRSECPNLLKTIKEAEKIRQDYEGSTMLFISEEEAILLANCDGYAFLDCKEFAIKHAKTKNFKEQI